jgi:hypothetical protein
MTKEDHEKHVIEIVQEYLESRQIRFNLPWREMIATFPMYPASIKAAIELEDPKRLLSVTTSSDLYLNGKIKDGIKRAALFCVGEEHPKKEIIKLVMDDDKKVDKQDVFDALDLLFHVEKEEETIQ